MTLFTELEPLILILYGGIHDSEFPNQSLESRTKQET